MVRTSAIALCLLVAGLGPGHLAETAQAQDADTPSCLRENRVNGFSVIDRQHIVLTSGASQDWLVTLTRPCNGLNFEQVIAIDGDGIGCIGKFDFVVFNDGSFPNRCRISTVEYVEDRDYARTLVEARSQAPDSVEAGSDG